MDYKMLEDNLADVILEAQLKLGYEGRSMSMNYPLQSLNRLLGTTEDGEGMKRLLDGFADFAQERLGRVEYSRHDGDIFRLCVPEKGVEYIHGLSGSASSGFLAELIAQVKQPGTTMEQVLEIFHRHSDRVHVEDSDSGEMDTSFAGA